MDVGVEQLGPVVRLAPRGRIDSATAPAFSDHMGRVIADGCRRMVVDFRDVKYITSAGFRALLVAEARMREAQGSLALCGVPKDVLHLFEIGAFTEDFVILPTLEDCVARFGP
ncbi:MAG TPA: STAS domain-containing protein [Usitatibacter sp.]|nr:STAS domain-containing protein [Usitatibacter sp.]